MVFEWSLKRIVLEGIRIVLRGRMLYRPEDLRAERWDIETITPEENIAHLGISARGPVKWDCEGEEIDTFRNLSFETSGHCGCTVGKYHIPKRKNQHSSDGYRDNEDSRRLIRTKYHLSQTRTSNTSPLWLFWAFARNFFGLFGNPSSMGTGCEQRFPDLEMSHEGQQTFAVHGYARNDPGVGGKR